MSSILSIFLLALLQAKVESQNLYKTINALNEGLLARTNIFYTFDKDQQLIDGLYTNIELPRVMIRGPVSFEVRLFLDDQILSIVLLNDFTISNELEQTLNTTLKRWQRTDIIFIVKTWDIKGIKPLFNWCWKQGFYNVLLTSLDDNQLWRFKPFPVLQPFKTSIALYLEQRHLPLNFQGYPIRVSIGNDTPRALAYYDHSNQLQLQGVGPRFVSLFARRHNATFVPVILSDLNHYDLYDCFEGLYADLVDVCGDISSYGDKNPPINNPLFFMLGFIMVRYAAPIDKFFYFLVPFQPQVWYALLVSVGFITLTLTLISRLQYGMWHIGKFFATTLSSFLYLSFNLRPLHGGKRHLIFAVLTLSGFLFSNLYLAYLSSILGTNVYEPQINTYEDLRDHNISILTHDYGVYNYRRYGVPEILLNQLMVVPVDELRIYRNGLDPVYAYLNLADRMEAYMYQQKFLLRPRMKYLEKPALTALSGLPFAPGWPFEELFHYHVLSIFACGWYTRIMEETKEEAIRLGWLKFFQTEVREMKPLDVNYIEMPGILLALGLGVAGVSFIGEKLRYRWERRGQRKS